MSIRRWRIGLAGVVFLAVGTIAVFSSGVSAGSTPQCGSRSSEVRQDQFACVVDFGSSGESWDPAAGAGGVTRDRNQPSLVSVRPGTTINFENVGAPHVVAIYDSGLNKNGTTNNLTTLRDVTYQVGVAPSVIDDPDGRLAIGGSGASVEYTFDQPGQYLVICAFRPHLENFAQATYVVVGESVN